MRKSSESKIIQLEQREEWRKLSFHGEKKKRNYQGVDRIKEGN